MKLLKKLFEKTPKVSNSSTVGRILLLSLVVGVLSGLVSGLIGVVAILSGSFSNTPFFEEFSLETILPDQQVIVRRQQAVTVTSQEQLASIGMQAEPTVITLLKRRDDKTGLASVYSQSDVLGYGVVLTSDGWIVVHEDILQSVNTRNLTVLIAPNRFFDVDEIMIDEVAGVGYIKIETADLLVSQPAEAASFNSGEHLVSVNQRLPSGQFIVHDLIVEEYSDDNIIHSTEVFLRQLVILNSYVDSYVPVYNFAGEFVGLTYESNSFSRGQHAVVPVSNFISIFENMLRTGEIVRPYLGINWVDLHGNIGLSEDIRQGYHKGAYIMSLEPNSPALAAGIKKGDIVLKIDDRELNGLLNFTELIQFLGPGEKIYLEVSRDRKILEFEVNLASHI